MSSLFTFVILFMVSSSVVHADSPNLPPPVSAAAVPAATVPSTTAPAAERESTTTGEVLHPENTRVEVKPDKTTKFAKIKSRLEKLLDFINIVGKIKAFAEKASKQNETSLNEAESFSFTVKSRPKPLTTQAKIVQEKLDKIQQQKIKQIEDTEAKLGN